MSRKGSGALVVLVVVVILLAIAGGVWYYKTHSIPKTPGAPLSIPSATIPTATSTETNVAATHATSPTSTLISTSSTVPDSLSLLPPEYLSAAENGNLLFYENSDIGISFW